MVDARSQLQLREQHDASLQDHRYQRGRVHSRRTHHARAARRRQNRTPESEPADEDADQQEQGGQVAPGGVRGRRRKGR